MRVITLTLSQNQNLSPAECADEKNVFADRFCLTATQKEAQFNAYIFLVAENV
jgi:predicted AAA+ superfamily ATPase